MARNLPPLQAAEAFLAIAHAPSLRVAADRLALSPSALSRRIQALEAFVGAALFHRSISGLCLTEAGRRYLHEMEPALDTLSQATLRLRGENRPLRIGASHTFTAEWLLPRLPGLLSQHGIRVEPVVCTPADALREGHVDLAFKGGETPPQGLAATPIGDGEAVLVAATLLADGRAPPTSPETIAAFPRLGVRVNPEIWTQWLSHGGAPDMALVPTKTYDTLQMTYEAAANGFGVTLALPLVAERFLRSGRLAPCFRSKRKINGRYWMLERAPCGHRTHPDRARFVDWMHQEVDISTRYFRDHAA